VGLLKVTVIVTVLDDPRLARTLASLRAQTRPADVVLIADGGNSPEIARICEEYHREDPAFVRLAAPGSIAETRNQAIRAVTTELIAFLDTDEVAPADWLGTLIAPLLADDRVGWTGGPTPALGGTTPNRTTRYYSAYLDKFYRDVARTKTTAIPMGNSAWKTRLFEEVGALIVDLPKSGGEDPDIENRAAARGWRGVYVEEAHVYHDYSEFTFWSLLKKQYRYARGGYVVWRAHGTTYEASGGDVAYVLLPFLAVVGAVVAVLPWGWLPLVGWAVLGIAAAGFALLFGRLAIQGRRGEAQYPGYRYRPLIEPFRKWATVLGALEAMLARGRRM